MPYQDALGIIHARADYAHGFISDPFWGDAAARLGLRRMETLLDRLGRPDQRYPIVHVAGSKGKGSTCAFAAAILGAAGYRVGLTTSPHLHTFRERIVVAGEMISEAAFAAVAERIDAMAEGIEDEVPDLGRFTAFELLTAMALEHFGVSGCDVAVVEVGMGGALDSTNVVMPAVSVITTLDYEHTAVLGETLAEIAANKAGIIKPGRPVVTADQPAEALAVIERVAAAAQSRVSIAGRDWQTRGSWQDFSARGPWGELEGLRSGIAGEHQMENAVLAMAALSVGGDDISVRDGAIREGLNNARLPVRFEVVTVEGRTIVLDGAHTPLAAEALAATLRAVYPDTSAIMVIGAAGDKRIEEIAASLAPRAGAVVATTSRSPRAIETHLIARAFQRYDLPVFVVSNVGGALATAISMATPDNLILVTGSFNVVAEAREALGLAEADFPH